jgi:hypothetical protein
VLSLFKTEFSKLSTQWLKLDLSFVQSLPSYLPLLEQFDQKNIVIAPCLSEVSVSNLTTTPNSVDIDLDMKIEAWIRNTDANSAKHSIKASTLTGHRHARVEARPGISSEAFLSGKSDSGMMFASSVFPMIWQNAFFGTFDKFLHVLDDQDSIEVKRAFQKDLAVRLSAFRVRQKSLVTSAFVSEGRELDQTREELVSLSRLGLDDSSPLVRKWLELIEDDRLFASPSQIIENIYEGKQSIAEAQAQLEEMSNRLNSALDALESESDLHPGPDLYENRLDELRKLRFLRALAERKSQPEPH